MIAANTSPQSGPKSEPPLAKWQIAPTDFGIFIALLFSLMSIVSAAFGKFASWMEPVAEGETIPLLVTLAQTLGMQCGMLLAYVIFRFLILRGFNSNYDYHPKPRATPSEAIAVGLKWLLISYPFVIAAHLVSHYALNAAGFEQTIQEPVRLVREGGSTIERSLMYLMIVVGAPISEELVFRGAIFRFLHRRLPLYLALGLSGALFALTHFNLYSFTALMALGITLALAYRETNSLIAPIVLHTVFNATNLILILQTGIG